MANGDLYDAERILAMEDERDKIKHLIYHVCALTEWTKTKPITCVADFKWIWRWLLGLSAVTAITFLLLCWHDERIGMYILGIGLNKVTGG